MFSVYNWYKLSRILYLYKIPVLPLIIKMIMRVIFAAHIPYQAHIGKGCVLGDEGLGIAIHPRAVIGNNCVIGPHVLIGGTSHKYKVPRIGSNVLIGPGAKILGPIIVEDNSVIGANSVVVSDVRSNSIVSGIPAKTIKENIDINDYL